MDSRRKILAAALFYIFAALLIYRSSDGLVRAIFELGFSTVFYGLFFWGYQRWRKRAWNPWIRAFWFSLIILSINLPRHLLRF